MEKNCTVYKTADFIGKKWTMLILLEIYKGEKNKIRYSKLKKSLPDITPKVLSSRLKELILEGLISKHIDTSEFPIKCEYSLTKSGKDFISIIKQMKAWALKWKIKNELCSRSDCLNCPLQI